MKNTAVAPDTPPSITAPASDTIIALDPDIPPEHHRISFSAEGRGLRWLIDGKELARGALDMIIEWRYPHATDTYHSCLLPDMVQRRPAAAKRLHAIRRRAGRVNAAAGSVEINFLRPKYIQSCRHPNR